MAGSLVIHTDQMRRNAPCVDTRIDITVMTADGAGAVLAPVWAIVYGHKLHRQLEAGEKPDTRWKHYSPITWEQYTDIYLRLLRERYAAEPGDFHWLIGLGELTLCCYCKPGEPCHRHLAADVLRKIAVKQGMEVSVIPELSEKGMHP